MSNSTSPPPPQHQPLDMKPSTTSSIQDTTPKSPLPPAVPCPWLWRCHSCYTIYRLAVTRRCLDCDHTFCLGEAIAPATMGRKRKRNRGGPCKAEFDYTGWKIRGAWRRTVLLNGAASASHDDAREDWGDEHAAAAEDDGEELAGFEAKRDALFLRRRHDCWVHCDFPSECHHALFRAQQEGRPILREAEALDAALREAEEEENRGRTKKLTVLEYKQRRLARRQKSTARHDKDLSTVEEETEGSETNNEDVSPCSPTLPEPPRELIREVSPIDAEPVSPSRTSLAVTDTPADFAITAAPLDFDDYSDEGDEPEQRRTKSRRKIARLTGEGLQSFAPFMLDRSVSSSSSRPTAHIAENAGQLTAHELQDAYSERAWFGSSSNPEPLSPKSPERIGKRDTMFALLGRRSGGGGPPSPTRSSIDTSTTPTRQLAREHRPRDRQQAEQHRADVGAAAGSEDWESWSDSSSSSASSNSSAVSLFSSSSNEGEGDQPHAAAAPAPPFIDGTDVDGDVTMREAGALPLSELAKDVDEDMSSPVTPLVEQGDEEESLRALLRMRNAFMRGEMM
ncbi:hypothetical protein N8I77_003505 [Diaporthe amygdali]|uniref:Uncharacterized protein n=1 Tax=Phomopsis amygdali TaxID=1214568 RepID=A0AAD9W7Q8_PHOAM|nr:hypothetical protein N8I77_003505 [Diaporthe amygdali]